MRQFLILLLLLFSCSKDTQPPDQIIGTISFDANGQHIEYPATGAKLILPQYTAYTFSGTNSPNNFINLQIYTDSLHEQPYEVYRADHPPAKGEAMLDLGGQFYTSFDSTQKITVNVTSYSGGILNATFAGLLVWPKDSLDLSAGFDSAIIENGKINVNIIY